MLDRSLATPDWRLAFPNAKVSHLTALCSDHCPILTDLHYMRGKKPKKPFRFETMWLRHAEFNDHVTSTWTRLFSHKDNLHSKFLNLGSALTNWNSYSFGDVSRKIMELKVELDNLRSQPRTTISADEEVSLT